MTDDLKIVTVPRDLYYHEIAYVRGLEAEAEQLRAALEPFARNVDAISLVDTLGHITREDLLRARAALRRKP